VDWFWGYLMGRNAALRQMERQQLAQMSPEERKEHKRAKFERKLWWFRPLAVIAVPLGIVGTVATKDAAPLILAVVIFVMTALGYRVRVRRWPWQTRAQGLARQQVQQATQPAQWAPNNFATAQPPTPSGPPPPPAPQVRNGLAGSMQQRRGVWGPGLAGPAEIAAALTAPRPDPLPAGMKADRVLPLGLADGATVRGRGPVLGWGVPAQARRALLAQAVAESQGCPILWVNEGGLVPSEVDALATGRNVVHLDLSRTCTGEHPHAVLQAANADGRACADFGFSLTFHYHYDGPSSPLSDVQSAVGPLVMAALWAAGLRGTPVAETAGWVRSGQLGWIVSTCAQGRPVEECPRFVGATQSLLQAQPDFVARVTREVGDLLAAVQTAEQAPPGGAAYQLRAPLDDPSLLVVLSLPDRPSRAEYNLASTLCMNGDSQVDRLVVCDDLRPPGGIWVPGASYVWQARPGPGVVGDGYAEQILVGLPLADPAVREHVRPGVVEADRFAQGGPALLLLSQQAAQPAVLGY